MTIAEDIARLESRLAECETELNELHTTIDLLPSAPPGFGNTYIDRLRWTVRWIEDNWSIKQECDEWKQRALLWAGKDKVTT